MPQKFLSLCYDYKESLDNKFRYHCFRHLHLLRWFLSFEFNYTSNGTTDRWLDY